MLRTFGTFLRGAQPVITAAAFRRRPRGVCYSYAATPEGIMTGPKAKVGQPAPHWRGKAVVQEEIKEISLEDYKVFLFYPADWSFVCPSEIISFNEALPTFKEHNATIVGASVDSVYCHQAWVTTPQKQEGAEDTGNTAAFVHIPRDATGRRGGIGAINFPLLSDITKQVARDYGVLIEDGPDAGHALRGLFIIDPEGKLRQKTVNDLQVGRSVDETLRLVQAFQFAEKHGDDCPVNWHPGMKGARGK